MLRADNVKTTLQMNMMGLMCGMAMCGMTFGVEKTSDCKYSCVDCVQ